MPAGRNRSQPSSPAPLNTGAERKVAGGRGAALGSRPRRQLPSRDLPQPPGLTGPVELAAFGHVEDFAVDSQEDAGVAGPVELAQLL